MSMLVLLFAAVLDLSPHALGRGLGLRLALSCVSVVFLSYFRHDNRYSPRYVP